MAAEKPRRRRDIDFHFAVNAEEAALIRERMARMGVTSMGAYFRKMAIDGYFVQFDFTDVRELVTLLRRCSNNLNQYARRANETGSIYAADIEDAQARLEEIWRQAEGILAALSRIQ